MDFSSGTPQGLQRDICREQERKFHKDGRTALKYGMVQKLLFGLIIFLCYGIREWDLALLLRLQMRVTVTTAM